MKLLATSVLALILASVSPIVLAFAPGGGLAMVIDAVAEAEPAPDAPAGIYVTDAAHTSVIWSLDHMGLSQWTARFVGADARLDWHPDAPETSRLTVRIDPDSLRTDFPHPQERDFDAEIAGGDGFLAGAPITFASDRIEITGDRTGRVFGQLSMRGESHPAVMDVTFNGSIAEHPFEGVPKVGFSARMVVKRSQWQMTALLPVIGDDVHVTIETQMVPPKV